METNNKKIKEKNFNELFTQISLEEISNLYNVFTLLRKDFYAVTAGRQNDYNSMVGSGGGFGLFFKKPTNWCLFKKDRYTLEIIRKEQAYTLSFFPEEYKNQLLFLGSKSGRNTHKMREVELTGIQIPSGNMSFLEAKLVVECELTAITTPQPNDFYSQESKDYINEIYNDANEYRQIVFGKITSVWLKK